ncbi:trypsin-like serine protease [Candidatus Shapirobacteria bacterium]|nr:trypsin-like serine protease [Candidatus Shapirobacteria bacterium]
MTKLKKILISLSLIFVVLFSLVGGAISDRLFGYKILDRFFPRLTSQGLQLTQQKILTEESVVIDVVEKVGPSVVTINVKKEEKSPLSIEFGPFGFSFPQGQGESELIEENIGTGFIISQDGLVVTNKHVVADVNATYRIITKDDQTYEVQKIFRDPANDLAILQINANGLKPVELGDSDQLKVGQFVIAIGTALGDFKDTVTTGVISGLGRGITAGSIFEGTERLDNVIQTDAAINPGNSGGPLLNSQGQVIGINVAVAAGGQNIGFAIPINVIKEGIDNFNQTGQFNRPFLGVRYRMVSRDVAIMNEVPQGAYIVEIIKDSAADKGGLKVGDIITEFDGQKVEEELSAFISQKKSGAKIKLTVWRDGEELELTVTLGQATE